MMAKDQVKSRLNQIGHYKEFTVVFTKLNGEQRKITGFLEPSDKPKKDAVPVKVTQGEIAGQYRSFKVDSVLSIEES